MQPGTRTYDVSVRSGDVWRWGFSWHAIDSATLREILRPLTLGFYINGVRVPDDRIVAYDDIGADGWVAQRWVMGITDWPAHQRFELEVRYGLSAGIFDGRDNFAPGQYRQMIYVSVE